MNYVCYYLKESSIYATPGVMMSDSININRQEKEMSLKGIFLFIKPITHIALLHLENP